VRSCGIAQIGGLHGLVGGDLPRRALRQHSALIEHADAVGEVKYDAHIMLDQHDGVVAVAVQPADPLGIPPIQIGREPLLENIAMAHPAVAMAACIGANHPKWDERPLLVVVKKPGAEVTRDELRFICRQNRQMVDTR
jgi:hypothetical protein